MENIFAPDSMLTSNEWQHIIEKSAPSWDPWEDSIGIRGSPLPSPINMSLMFPLMKSRIAPSALKRLSPECVLRILSHDLMCEPTRHLWIMIVTKGPLDFHYEEMLRLKILLANVSK
ncbi:hypothetical protein TNCV_519241 [Trichonephila clavipes]|nr:hypothetical protein TNCV_519241 [Trichonephila clavipes]